MQRSLKMMQLKFLTYRFERFLFFWLGTRRVHDKRTQVVDFHFDFHQGVKPLFGNHDRSIRIHEEN